MCYLGFLYIQQGETARAEARLQPAITLADKIGYALGRAQAEGALGMVALQRGDFNLAEERTVTAIRELQALRPHYAAWFRFNLCFVALARGDAGQAVKELEELVVTAHALKNEGIVVHALTALAPMIALGGDHRRAEDLVARGVETARGFELRRVLVMALVRGAQVATLTGAQDRAEDYLREVLGLLRNTAGSSWVADAVEMTVLALGARGRHRPATRLLGACDALRNLSGEVAEMAAISDLLRHYQDEATAALEPAQFASEWQRGAALSRDEMVREALAEI